MKKTHIAILCILVFIITIILIGVFFGHLLVRLGLQHPPYFGQPPAEDATLWQKAEWERLHGAIPTCGYPSIFIEGPVALVSTKNYSISYVAFNLTHSDRGESQDMTNVSITISTAEKEKTVRTEDPSVNLTLFTETRKIQGEYNFSYFESKETVRIKIDTEKMGFTATDLSPDQKMSLIITPSSTGCVKYAATITIPGELGPGVIRERENI